MTADKPWIENVLGVLADAPEPRETVDPREAPTVTRADYLARLTSLTVEYAEANDNALIGVYVEFPNVGEAETWDAWEFNGERMCPDGPKLTAIVHEAHDLRHRVAALEKQLAEATKKYDWVQFQHDLLPSETIGQHIRGDVFAALASRRWDLVILHPPCTYLTVSGNRWFRDDARASPGILTGAARRAAREESLAFVSALWAACDALGVPHATENPVGVISTRLRKPTQTIQPWEFGHPDLKGTCLWLTGLPALVPTRIVPKSRRVATVHRMPPGAHRQREGIRLNPRS